MHQTLILEILVQTKKKILEILEILVQILNLQSGLKRTKVVILCKNITHPLRTNYLDIICKKVFNNKG